MAKWQNIWLLLMGLSLLVIYNEITNRKYEVGYFSRWHKMESTPLIAMCVQMNATQEQYAPIQNCENNNSNNPYVSFVCFVSKLKSLEPPHIIKYARTLQMHRMFNITSDNHKFKESSIYMNNFHLCMTYETNGRLKTKKPEATNSTFEYGDLIESIEMRDIDYLKTSTYSAAVKMIIQVFNVFNVSAYLYINSNGERAYSFGLHKFFQHCGTKDSICNAGQIEITRTHYTRLKYPYKTDCFNYNGTAFNFTKNKIYSRNSCVNECRKYLYPKSSYLYTENDNYQLKDEIDVVHNSSFCSKMCPKYDCVSNFYYSTSWDSLTTSLPIIRIIFSNHQYEIITYGQTSQISYLLQVLSFFCLIYNNNLIAQIMKLHKESINHLNRFKYGKRLANLLRKELSFIRIYGVSLVLSLILFYKTTDILIEENEEQKELNYMAYTDHSIKYSHTLVTICFPLIDILNDEMRISYDLHNLLNRTNQTSIEHDMLKLNDRLLSEFTLSKLNEITKNETELIDAKFFFNDLRWQPLKASEVISFQPTFRLLRQTTKIINITLYSKCYVYNVTNLEYPMQRLFRMSTVRFKILNGHLFSHFVITENNQYPTFDDIKLFTVCHLNRLLFKTYKSSACKNYKMLNHGCSTRNECINECIKYEYIKRFRKIPFKVANRLDEKIVDRYGLQVDKIEPYIDQNPFIKQIEKNCRENYNLSDCYFNAYVNLHSCANEEFPFDSIRIRLYLPSIREFSVDGWSTVEFYNIILTILTILFGFSAPSILSFIFKCIRIMFKIQLNCLRKVKPIIRALLFLIMIYNFDSILTRALNNKPLPNTAYVAFDDFKLPRITTCVDYNYTNISETFKRENKILTGHILNELTAYITIDKLYDKIVYYSKEITPIRVSTKEMVKNRNLSAYNLSYEIFYFQNYKCFNIEIKIEYTTSNYRLFHIDDMIKLYLKADAPINEMLFSLSPSDTINLNKMDKIKNNSLNLVSFERYYLKFEDSFKYFRNPKLFFTKNEPKFYDEKTYLKFINEEMAKRNFTSVFLPIYEENFNLSIEDAKAIESEEANYLKGDRNNEENNLDYERFIIKSIRMHKKMQTHNNLTMLIINPNYLLFKVEFRNQEEPSTIILYLLNSISFWLDINVVDYPTIVIKVLNEEYRLIKNLYLILRFKLL